MQNGRSSNFRSNSIDRFDSQLNYSSTNNKTNNSDSSTRSNNIKNYNIR
jgi:hypothetical protein